MAAYLMMGIVIKMQLRKKKILEIVRFQLQGEHVDPASSLRTLGSNKIRTQHF